MSKCNKCCDESSSDESVDFEQCKCRDCTKSQPRCKKISRCREVKENRQTYQSCKYCKQTSPVTECYRSLACGKRAECIQPRDMNQRKYSKKCNITSEDYESAISVFNSNSNGTCCKPPENGNIIFITINP